MYCWLCFPFQALGRTIVEFSAVGQGSLEHGCMIDQGFCFVSLVLIVGGFQHSSISGECQSSIRSLLAAPVWEQLHFSWASSETAVNTCWRTLMICSLYCNFKVATSIDMQVTIFAYWSMFGDGSLTGKKNCMQKMNLWSKLKQQWQGNCPKVK